MAGAAGEIEDGDYVLTLAAGDRLEPYALSILAAQAARAGGPDALYADEDARRSGARSPQDAALQTRLESALFRQRLRRTTPGDAGRRLEGRRLQCREARVSHIRRVLLTRSDPRRSPPPRPPRLSTVRRRATSSCRRATVSICFSPCLESLKRYPAGADFELIVIDNGSIRPDVLAYLATIDGEPGTRVLRHPGPFNFSALCNAGARAAGAPFLVFLNDDVEALAADWLGRLLAFAAAAARSAPSAPKLLYPDGRLQHGGVVLGLDGFAGHRSARRGRRPRLSRRARLAARGLRGDRRLSRGRGPQVLRDRRLRRRAATGRVQRYRPLPSPRRARVQDGLRAARALMHRESASRGPNPRLNARYDGEHALSFALAGRGCCATTPIFIPRFRSTR